MMFLQKLLKIGKLSKERRRHQRFSCSHETKVRYDSIKARNMTIPGVIQNISVSGVLFIPSYNIEQENVYDNCRLFLDGDPKLINIIRVTYRGIHIEFDHYLNEKELIGFLEKFGIKK